MHGRAEEAERSIRCIEQQAAEAARPLPAVDDSRAIEVRPAPRTGFFTLARVLFKDYRPRSFLGATLMITQSFLYNAIFFTYTLVLTKFYGVSASNAPFYLIAFAAGKLLGPRAHGRLVGRHRRPKNSAGP